MKRVLVVDDEQSIRTLLTFNLEKAGYEVASAEDGETALDLIRSKSFDFIILDLMLPKLDGMEVCKKARQEKIETPILMLTAKDDELEKIIGLELGADDYMTKPFNNREVLARMKAILRRYEKHQISEPEKDSKESLESPAEETIERSRPKPAADDDSVIVVGDIEIYLNDFEVLVRGKSIEMTPKEFELLAYMAKRINRTLSRDQLLQKIWRFDYTGETRIVDVHISHLREKIEEDTKKPKYITTVRGFGYKFEEPN
ncbi:response regulator transcription factor [Aerococcus kribbianus]|uniref:Response regulator transcription factor n=1 Tax=Aerococcus kribbianus TaxID=2999064 RepID=A0A9X3JEU7_9LACT|nr:MULTISPECIES: response regulator transcription factor [unclassified Aerococcus]MCZ0717499.1 response regulator transcription factor [Aerococcus sp. YH-aer221]MCZ0725787.1 response regulator transcription factor [Aerococcus sp. YH-aer222]